MCGISAIISRSRDGLDSAIAGMVSVMVHRGPDGNGTYVDQVNASSFIALGHNRLSILDLTECAAQPMTSRDGRYVLIYNGEVYNFRELAQQLARDELPAGTYGDTAVILAALIKWGPLALAKFNGMWSIVLYDSLNKTLLISRDRFGVKPLYYYKDDRRFYLASEIKAILLASSSKFPINPYVAVPYLTRGLLNCSDDTFFSGIRQFPAGSYQICNLRDPQPFSSPFQRFWLHPFERGEDLRPGAVSVEEVKATFTDAVRLRLRSDVPLGVLLSGGVDSSSIVGVIATLQSMDNLQVLSVISDDPASNEGPFVDLMADHVRCTPHKVNVSADPLALLGNLSEACWYNDEPIMASADLAHLELMKLAKARGLKVLLSGQGADEQLGGYNKFFYFYVMSLFKSGHYYAAARTVAQFATCGNVLSEFRLSEAVRYVAKTRLARDTFIHPTHQACDTINIGYQGSYAQREWIELTRTSVPALNHYEDRMSMSQSVEVRVPFLDYRLVEMFARVHPSEKFEGGWTKAIFRKAIEALVPFAIQYRRDKKGFTVPENDWTKGPFKPYILDMFQRPMKAERLDIVDRQRLMTQFAQCVAGRSYLNGRHFFRAYIFETFLKRFDRYISEGVRA